ncbi:MAG: hypothetical protein ACYS9Y_12805 [Planctomycetota bacterium]|jgi:hypothetical protein
MKKQVGKAIGVMLFVLSIVLIVSLFTRADPVDQYHSGWKLIRETATEDGATFAAVYNLASDGGNFANKDSSTVANGGPYQIRSHQGRGTEYESSGTRWVFAICGGAAINDTFSFNVVGWARINGMAQVICEGDGVIGTQDVVLYPDDSATATSVWWADTITLDETTKWTSSANEGTLAVLNSGGNEVALLVIDLAGIEWIQFVFYDADDAVGGEADPITVYGRPYN